MLGFIDSDKSLCSMVPSPLFKFIFLHFSATHKQAGEARGLRAAGFQFVVTCVAHQSPPFKPLWPETLRLAFPCRSFVTIVDIRLHSGCIITTVLREKEDDTYIWRTDASVLISILHFPALSSHFQSLRKCRNHNKWRTGSPTYLPAFPQTEAIKMIAHIVNIQYIWP